MTHKNLQLCKEKGKYGYKDENGKWIVEPKFMMADEFDRGSARVQLDGMWGYLKEDGSWLVEPTLSAASPFSEELARVRKDFFYGFINRKGEWFLEPNLLEASDFENNTIAFVKNLDSKGAFISNKGKMITDFSLDPIPCFSSDIRLSDNRIRAKKDGKYGFLDSDGNWVVPPVYDEAYHYEEGCAFVKRPSAEKKFPYDLIDLDGNVILQSVGLKPFESGFSDGVAVVKVPAKSERRTPYFMEEYGVIDPEGKWIVSPEFGEILKFVDGFAITTKHGKKGVIDAKGNVVIDNIYDQIKRDDDYFEIELKKKSGLADKTGKVVLPPKYEFCMVRKDGLFSIKSKKGYGLADLKGKEIIKPDLDSQPEFDSTGYARIEKDGKYGWVDRKGAFLTDSFFDDTLGFSEGMAAVKTDGLWGFIDETGNMVIEPQFDVVRNFQNGVSTVGISGHWGLISKSGEWLTEPKFDEIKEFAEGVAPAKIFNLKARSSKWGFIDESARFVIEPEFDDLESFNGPFARAKADGKWGIIGKDGKWLVAPQFDDIKNFNEGLAKVINDGLTGLVDESGNTVVEPKYEEIYDFSDAGVAEVKIKNAYGFINRQGEEIVPVQIRDESYFNTETKYLWAMVKGKWGYLDSNGGRWIIEPKYDEVYDVGCEDSLMGVEQDGKWGVIDCNDNWIVPPVCDSEFNFGKSLDHGLLRVESEDQQGYYDIREKKWALPLMYEKAEYIDRNVFLIKKDGEYALCDSEGRPWGDEWYEDAFHGHGVVWLKKDGKYGVIDRNRTWILPPTFGWVHYNHGLFPSRGIIRVEINGRMALADFRGNILGGRTYKGMHEYANGYFPVVDEDNMGLIDTKGDLIVPTICREIETFFGGLAVAQAANRKYGYVDTNGKWAIPPEFDATYAFRTKIGGIVIRYARVKIDGKYGVIDREGKWIVEPKFDKIGDIDSILAVCENGKWGYINLEGEWIVPPIYLEADDFCNGFGSVLTDDFKRFFVDSAGKLYKRKPN